MEQASRARSETDVDPQYQAWEMGSALGELENHLRIGFRGLVTPKTHDPQPGIVDQIRAATLSDFRKGLQRTLGLYDEMDLGRTDDLRPQLRGALQQVEALKEGDLPNNAIADGLQSQVEDWSTSIRETLLNRSSNWSYVLELGFMLSQARSIFGIFLERTDSGVRLTRFKGRGFDFAGDLEALARRLRGEFPKDTIDAVIYSVDKWEAFSRQFDKEKVKLGIEANRKIDEQVIAWRALLIEPGTPARWIAGSLDQLLVIAIPRLVASSIFLGLVIAVFLIVNLLGIVLDLQRLKNLDDTLKLVLSGGLAGLIAWVFGVAVRTPFNSVRDKVRLWRLKVATAKTPSTFV